MAWGLIPFIWQGEHVEEEVRVDIGEADNGEEEDNIPWWLGSVGDLTFTKLYLFFILYTSVFLNFMIDCGKTMWLGWFGIYNALGYMT